jgi:hypothetical protein
LIVPKQSRCQRKKSAVIEKLDKVSRMTTCPRCQDLRIHTRERLLLKRISVLRQKQKKKADQQTVAGDGERAIGNSTCPVLLLSFSQ